MYVCIITVVESCYGEPQPLQIEATHYQEFAVTSYNVYIRSNRTTRVKQLHTHVFAIEQIRHTQRDSAVFTHM